MRRVFCLILLLPAAFLVGRTPAGAEPRVPKPTPVGKTVLGVLPLPEGERGTIRSSDELVNRLETRVDRLESELREIRALIAELRRARAQQPTRSLIPPPTVPPKLARDYQFAKTLADATNQGPALTALNGSVSDASYEFAAGNGLRLDRTGVTDHYTLELTFRLDEVEGWRKVVDFRAREEDAGLYVYEGQLQFYGHETGGRIEPGKDYHIRLERDRTTRAVRVSINGVPAFEFVDTEGAAVFADGVGYFFVDDSSTDGAEASGGSLKRLRIWDGPLG